MANSEHVAQLQEGVEAWNLWREQNPDIQPDLSETDLSRVNLGETDFCGADTTEVFDAQVVKVSKPAAHRKRPFFPRLSQEKVIHLLCTLSPRARLFLLNTGEHPGAGIAAKGRVSP